MKKAIILFISILALGLTGCRQKAQPQPRPSQVKTVKVVSHQVISDPKKKQIKRKAKPKFNFFILPSQKKKRFIYTYSNNILAN